MVLTANRREPQSAAPADAAQSQAAAPARDRRAAQAWFAPPAIPLADAAVDARPAGSSIEPAASQPVAAPLNLSLPRARGGRQAQPQTLLGEALDDPRTNTPRASPGERMWRALGTDQRLIEEQLGGDRVRMRRGTDCVVVSRSRESELDPFNQSVNPSARGVTSCP